MLPSDLKVIADIGFPETAKRVNDEIESLRQQLAEANAKVAFLQGDGSIVGYPWDAPYSDGVEMATAKYRERIIATEEMYEAKIADLTARLEEQEVSKPVAWVMFCSDGSYEGPIMDCDRRMEWRRESASWTPLYTTPQPTPTVKAAVAAALRKAADVVSGASVEWLADYPELKTIHEEILAIPHDDSALEQYVQERINETTV